MASAGAEEFASGGHLRPRRARGRPSASSSWRYLDDRGVALAAMVEADRAGGLGALASELPLRAPGEPLSVEEVAARGATTVDRVRRVRLAAGLPTDLGDPGHLGLPSTVVDDMVSFEAGAALFGEAPTLSFTRVMGAAVSQGGRSGGEPVPHRAPAGAELRRPPSWTGHAPAEDGTATFIAVTPAADDEPAARAHGPRHPALGGERTLEVDDRAVTVGLGFVDLVGSTAWASGLSLKDARPGAGRVRDRSVGHRLGPRRARGEAHRRRGHVPGADGRRRGAHRARSCAGPSPATTRCPRPGGPWGTAPSGPATATTSGPS